MRLWMVFGLFGVDAVVVVVVVVGRSVSEVGVYICSKRESDQTIELCMDW